MAESPAITDEHLVALREHFAAGPTAPDGITVYGAAPSPVTVILYVLKLRLPARGESAVIAVDGSAPTDPRKYGAAPASGCAAVATDGRVLIGWFETPDSDHKAFHAEWQAVRLGLRLAARYPAATMIVDNRQIARQIQRAATGQRVDMTTVGGIDKDAASEIRGLATAGNIAIACRGNTKAEQGKTGNTPLTQAAHAAAWVAHRLASEGFDPREHIPWIIEMITLAPPYRSRLQEKYQLYAVGLTP